MGKTPQYKKAEKYYRDEIEDQKSPDRTGLKYHSSYDWLIPVAKTIVNGSYDDVDIDDLLNAGGRCYSLWQTLQTRHYGITDHREH